MKHEDPSQLTSPATFQEAVSRTIEDHEIFAGVRRLVVGCSAGADSTVLLDVLIGLAPRFDLELAVCHLNHGVRGAAADEDERHVRDMAESAGLEGFVERVDLSGETGSFETIARQARLEHYARAVAALGADAVALGHSANDQAETVLMNLARGTGPAGLGGIRPRSTVNGLLILRPLLFARRDAIRAYARERGLAWRDDESNADPSITRNRVRQRLLPELEGIHPRAIDNIARAAALAQAEEDWLTTEIEAAFRGMLRQDSFPGAVSLSLDGLADTPLGLRRRVIRRALEEVRGHRRGISAAHIDAVLEQALGGDGGAVDVPGARAQTGEGIVRLLPLEGRNLEPALTNRKVRR